MDYRPELKSARARGRNTRQLVHVLLRERITSLDLEPGAALSENELAEELGVSRTPVRESLILLADEGLVDVYPQMGTFVSRIRLRDIASAQFVREALECAALTDAVQRATDDDLAELRHLLDEQTAAERRDDMEGFFRLDERFHARLMAASGHGDAWPVVSNAKTQLDRARRLSLPLTQQLTILVGQHRAVVDLLARRDGPGALDALRSHLRLVFSDIETIRARHPELFSDDETDGHLRRAPLRRPEGGRRTAPAKKPGHR
ncbi:GntR family transcriptional regulator [Streptomyces sp. NPDC093085]|uniref:GntR family transcriptional regulator n=1 Tax=Streptomyces sp. NPDC093085 TaxID=3155068 RepID=UPI003449F2D8